ncbi:MAG: lipoyl(octanoyl) transferase LipB [Candidatus Kapaibacteriales bacterium]
MIELIDWGLIDYNEAWNMQKELVSKLQNRKKNQVKSDIDGFLVFCEHPSVITMGKNTQEGNLVKSEQELNSLGISTIPVNRGGDVTLHNPGQIVGYPIIDLSEYKEDLHWFLRTIEQTIAKVLEQYGIEAEGHEEYTGVWIEGERKICAIGLHCSRWITSHGFAFNIGNDISEFDYIVPCGIEDKAVTSLKNELMINSKSVANGTRIDNRDYLLKGSVYESLKTEIAVIFKERMNEMKKSG